MGVPDGSDSDGADVLIPVDTEISSNTSSVASLLNWIQPNSVYM